MICGTEAELLLIWTLFHVQTGGQLTLQNIDQLEQHRSHLYGELAETGDLRRGCIGVTFRRCGKPNCACADPEHPGHGPRHRLTRSVGGKTEAIQLNPGPELEKARREVAGYKRFKSVVDEIVEVNEQICDARPLPDAIQVEAVGDGQKRGSKKRSKRSSPPR